MKEPDIDLKQIFLPFFDINKKIGGVQFGLPSDITQRGLQGALAKQSKMSVVKLYTDGKVERQPYPILTPISRQKTDPPTPLWAWVPIEINDTIEYARLVAPKRGWGSVPLWHMKQKGKKYFYTNQGLDYYKLEPSIYDITNESLILSEPEDGLMTYEFEILDQNFGKYTALNGVVIRIEPSDYAIDLGLWTSHLARCLYVSECKEVS